MTSPRLLLPLSARLRRLVAALLLVALPLYGLSGALLNLLGPDHRHAAGPSAFTPWSELVGRHLQSFLDPQTARLLENLRLQARLQPSAPDRHAHGAGAHDHHHGFFTRHHHAAQDASVVTSGTRADGHDTGDAATAGALQMPLAWATALTVPPAPARATRWPARAASPWHSHVPGPPERPPRA